MVYDFQTFFFFLVGRLVPFRVLLEETFAGGVVQPGVVVGAGHAGVQAERLSGQFLGAEGTGVRNATVGLTLGDADRLPLGEVLGAIDVGGRLDPLDDLGHGHQVDVLVIGHDLVQPLDEGVLELGVVLEPDRVEEEAQGRPVRLVMPLEIVVEEIVELLAAHQVAARVDHGATW